MRQLLKPAATAVALMCALVISGSAIAQEEAAPAEAAPAEVAPAEAAPEEFAPVEAAPAPEVEVVEAEEVEALSSVEPLPQSSIFAEGLGAGFLYSFNYEHVLPMDFAVRVGFGYIGLSGTETVDDVETSISLGFFSIPITFSWLGLRTDSGTHMLELGLGTTVIGVTASGSVDIPLAGSLFAEGATATALPHVVLGYRLQAGWYQLRAGITPFLSIGDTVDVVILPHLSMGAAF